RFCEMKGCVAEPDFDPTVVRHTVNRWILGKLADLSRQVDEALEGFRFNEAAGALYQFTWGTFCDWYLEFTKPILDGADDAARKETQATTGWVLDRLLLRRHPFMPSVTEELAEKRGRTDPLITSRWPEPDAARADPAAAAEMDWVIRLITQIRAVRAEMNVPPGARITALLQGASDETLRRLDIHRGYILRLARLETIEPLSGEIPAGAVQVIVDECTVALPLADVIDLAAERARLQRELDKTAAEIGK